MNKKKWKKVLLNAMPILFLGSVFFSTVVSAGKPRIDGPSKNVVTELDKIDPKKGVAILRLINEDNLNLLKYLICDSSGTIANVKDLKLLHLAAKANAVSVANFLLDNGWPVDDRANESVTPLQNAVENESGELVELLINKGANVNERNIYGETALHYAAFWFDDDFVKSTEEGNELSISRKRRDIIMLLVSHGIDVNAVDEDGKTAFIWAASFANLQISRMLLSIGANPMIMDKDGLTALHYAVLEEYDPAFIDLWIESGLDINVKSSSGMSALDYVLDFGGGDIVEKLIECGAEPSEDD